MSVKALCDLGWFLQNYRTELLQDEFFNYSSGGLFTTVSATGTAVADDTAGSSKVLLTTAATDNNYCGLKSTNQSFLPAAGHPIFGEGRLTYTNQATTTANIVFGFASATALTMTDGTDPAASFSGAVIYKLDGGTVWRVQSSNGSTKTTTVSNVAATNGTYNLRIDFNDFDSAQCEVVYTVNGKQLTDSNNVLIKHKLAYSGLVKQNLIALAQAGSANAQTCYVDFLAAGQLRSGL